MSDSCDWDTWSRFFTQYDEFSEKRDAQKSRGLNDYNLLASVLPVNDEVRLHSGVLASLLDPQGKHYQGGLFLDLFLDQLGLTGWLDSSLTTVQKERDCVDIYLTDGTRHLVIENKLNAGDQKAQLQRYVKNVQDQYQATANDIVFLYLTKGRTAPSRSSLGGWELKRIDSHVAAGSPTYVMGDSGPMARYLNAHYQREVLDWLAACRQEVANLANLRFALDQYRQVVERATKRYRSPVMSLKDFLEASDQQLSREERYAHAVSIVDELPKAQADWLESAMKEGVESIVGQVADELAKDQLSQLQKCFLNKRSAETFFRGGHQVTGNGKNSGVFWLVNTGEYRGKLMIFMIFGAKYLHVGVAPLPGSGGSVLDRDDLIRLFGKKTEGETSHDYFLEDRSGEGMGQLISGSLSWRQPLIDEVFRLMDFESSRVARVLERIVRNL